MKQIDDDSLKYLGQYIDVSEHVKKCIESHAKKHKLNPTICAWYKDMTDFYLDWVTQCGYIKTQADRILKNGIKSGEFLWLPDGLGLVRFEM